ncbi:MAG: DUF1232 domain-containing protein [Candidatus Aegiribacteria sp.]|nr:DUF1232 domain-containing protein [Candidatus Aegiribacteria sp.]
MRNLGRNDKTRLERMFRTGLDSVSAEQVEQAAARTGRKIGKLESSGIPNSLEGLWQDIKLLYSLVGDVVRGRYRVPYRTIGAVAFTLLYFVNPFDLIPDVIPFVGYVDDAFVVSLCIKFIGTDLEKYRKWMHSENKQIQEAEKGN